MTELNYPIPKKLDRGTVLSVRITTKITSKSKTIPVAIVENDVKDKAGSLLIKQGTPILLQIDRKRAKGCGKAGYLSVKCVSTTSVDGQTVILNGNLEDEGSNRIGLAIALAICLGFTILPLFGFFFLALKGKQAKIESNTIIPNVFVMNEYFIKE